MNFKIVADSGCEVNKEIKEKVNVSIVPMSLSLGEQYYTDDENLDVSQFLKDMKISPFPPKSSSPAPMEFMKNYEGAAETVFAVTISSKVSSSYNNAVLAKQMFLEQYGQKFIYVFNSLTASVGETLVVLKIFELARKNFKNTEIVEKVMNYIDEMKTFFLLESIDHLIKSGRINRLMGTLATVLSIKPIMGSSKEGNIDLIEKVRGSKKAFRRMLEMIGEKGEGLEDKILGIAHCNCLEKAVRFKKEALKKYNFKDIIIVEMGPTISAYADEGGLLIAF